MICIAILGYGVVGSGVAQVIKKNHSQINNKAGNEICIKHILDIRDFNDKEVKKILTRNFDDILNDDEVRIIVETMGGLTPAFEYVRKALERGKHVCTSNKELVATHGARLLEIAKKNNVSFLFEASVGGGIPVIRPINTALSIDTVLSVSGILNGTTNYILTQMESFGKTFEEALSKAQELGYAEKNPEADIKGFDSCRKLAILLSIASGRQISYDKIQTEGIDGLQVDDFILAQKIGYKIKLMAQGAIKKDGVEALVAPMLIKEDHQFANVPGVFNAVLVHTKSCGDTMFYGQGAGSEPTALAVISDIIDIATNIKRHIKHIWAEDELHILPAAGYLRRRMTRVKTVHIKTTKEMVVHTFGKDCVFIETDDPCQLGWLSPFEDEGVFGGKINEIKKIDPGIEFLSVIRIFEETNK